MEHSDIALRNGRSLELQEPARGVYGGAEFGYRLNSQKNIDWHAVDCH
jgi:hypothetical protein